MSSTPNTADNTTDQPATDRVATASDRLWAALHARPGATAEQLSGDAGIGRSTATKILARWVTDGTVERARSPKGRKSASRFTIAAPTAEAGPVTLGEDGPAASAPHTRTNEGAPGSDETTAATGDAEANLADAAATGDDVAAAPDSRTDTTGPAAPTKRPRLAPGALHGMVEDYLRDHAGHEFGPTKIGHDLGRSPGAISNALERLTNAGYATRTKDRPKRYTLATTDTTHPADRAEPDKQER